MSLRLFSNDSDHADTSDDFVSFPTLPHPEKAPNRSISTIITKTLRKVTNNASNLVHTYTSPRAESPRDPVDSLLIAFSVETVEEPRVVSDDKFLRISLMHPTTQVSLSSNVEVEEVALEKEPEKVQRIALIFNNLPNDIELSDESASDLEPVERRERRRRTPLRKVLSNVSLDAKIVSSTSSVASIKRKHQSDNPLKNGGIPKKYWMNDSFVSECLNCFKPFTAFRRKHHCRFCGQIFCSACTIFISYIQYKEQRRDIEVKNILSYKDKLRVCKSCYSDVVVYLSDDSLSSSELEVFEFDDSEDDRVVSRFRSRLVNSHRDSINLSAERNRIFLNETPSSVSSDTQKSPEKMYRNPPQIAIPTTRAGESVEIPISKSPYNGHTLSVKTNLALLAMKNAASSIANSPGETWRNLPPELERLDNFGIYSLFRNRIRSKLENDFKLKTDDDAESENEDEQVMSLYTSLNHTPVPQLGAVPTLREFPAMAVSDKYLPATLAPNGKFQNFPIGDEKRRSDHRSLERASASLRRIRLKRNQKSYRRHHRISTEDMGPDSPTSPAVDEPEVDVYGDHIDRIIIQCLEDCEIKDPKEQQEWRSTILGCLSTMHQLKLTDTIDIKQYVKIKKVLGGLVADTCVIEGLFMTKNIDSKKMKRLIKSPKIALLMFPIEYLKHKEQYISLRIVSLQQSVYIGNLVSRLISLEPDVIVVGDTVCGLAAKQLEEANVTVLSNVKPQVIERISRYTKGDIFQSVNDLFFKKGTLGTCEKFEVKSFIYGNLVKTYSFFTGTDVLSGFTISLRGGDKELLSSAKYTTESILNGVFNSKFEKSFLKDMSIQPGNGGASLDVTTFRSYFDAPNESTMKCTQEIEKLGIVSYIKLFAERVLSTSPSVSFTLPSALINIMDSFVQLAKFAQLNSQIQAAENAKDDWFDVFKLPKTRDAAKIIKYVSASRLESLSEDVSLKCRLWANSMKHTTYQLYPIFHRGIHFLHSTVSLRNSTPCTGPGVVLIDYYTDNDKSLGQFLDQIIQDTCNTCDECGELMLNHSQTFVHNNQKLDLVVENLDSEQNERLMWSVCSECKMASPVVLFSEETYFWSLGKFFEQCFWAKGKVKVCDHDFFKKHVKFFEYKSVVVRMSLSPVETFEVVVPRKKLVFAPEFDIQLKIDAFEQIKKKADAFFASVSKRLTRVKVDTFDKAEAGHRKVEELKQKLNTQIEVITSKMVEIYEAASPSNYMALNVILRDLQELGVAWDTEFNKFELDFLPTENEITKITQLHLRNFLMDKLDTEMKPKEETREEPSPELYLDRKDFVNLGTKMRVPSAIIEDKILQIKKSLESDVKTPKSQKEDEPHPNRVQDLTNYFNQMTLEFQRLREQVLERKSTFKAIPIGNSQPIVEIYDNIEDVVDTNYDWKKDKEEPEKKLKIEFPQPERNSLLKTLSNFWADRSATLWDPLAYPLDFTEHTFADSDVIVREDEPSSLVAFCLSSADYKQKIAQMAMDGGDHTLETNDLYRKKLSKFVKIEKKFKKSANLVNELEVTMSKEKTNHLKYQFVDGGTEMSCKIFYSEQFEAFRKASGIDDSFVQSLLRCVKWNLKGGKSGSNFLKTLDNRYIVKELSKSELELFVLIAPFYFKYISQFTFNTLTTALAKIFGFYQTEVKNLINGKTLHMGFLIMENLFHNRKTTRIFDLKGSMRNRHVKQTGKENEVLLDENMVEYIYESPVFVKEQLKKLLRGSLFNDTSFLSAMDVMDYSLVIGIDDELHKLYAGIIDWLRTFTWDKKVENWVKGNSLVKKGKDPTIVTPKQYRIRFREAMDRYILEVPDNWYEGK